MYSLFNVYCHNDKTKPQPERENNYFENMKILKLHLDSAGVPNTVKQTTMGFDSFTVQVPFEFDDVVKKELDECVKDGLFKRYDPPQHTHKQLL